MKERRSWSHEYRSNETGIDSGSGEQAGAADTYERNAVSVHRAAQGVYVTRRAGQRLSRPAERHRGVGAGLCASCGHRRRRSVAQSKRSDAYVEPLLPRGTQPSLALRLTEMSGTGPRVLLQLRHGGVGGRAEAGARATAGRFARLRASQIGTDFLAMEHSFHGRTMGAVATTHKEKYREPFAPVMPGRGVCCASTDVS